MEETEELDRDYAIADALLVAFEATSQSNDSPTELVKELAEVLVSSTEDIWVPTIGDEVSYNFGNRLNAYNLTSSRELFQLSDYNINSINGGISTGIIIEVREGNLYVISTFLYENYGDQKLPPSIIHVMIELNYLNLIRHYNEEEYMAIIREKQSFVNKALNVIKKFREKTEAEQEILRIQKIEEEQQKKLRAIKKRVKIFEAICEELHPGAWDLQIAKNTDIFGGNTKYVLIIKFTEVIIRNSKRKQHTITNLYVSFNFDEKLNYLGGMKGRRGTVSYNEMRSAYMHSHLGRRNRGAWSSFCTGNGDMPNTMMSLQADGWNPDLLQKMLLLLYTYVSWESIEGGPYILISDINGGRSRSINYNPSEIDKQKYLKAFIKINKDFPISYSTEHLNCFKINPQLIEPLLTPLVTKEHSQIKNVDGEYFNIDTSSENKRQEIDVYNAFNRSEGGFFNFKGDSIYTGCVEEIQDVIDKDSLRPHYEITRYIAKALEKSANLIILKIQ